MDFPGQAGRPSSRPLQQDPAHSLNTPDTPPPNIGYSFLDGTPFFKYSDYERFHKAVKDHIDALQKTAASLYLEFCGVSNAEFDVLFDDQHHPTKSVWFSYHHHSQTLLLKFRPMSGGDHETLISLFQGMVNEQLRLMGIHQETLSRGSPLTRVGEWTKEPDWCWAPQGPPRLAQACGRGGCVRVDAAPSQQCTSLDRKPSFHCRIRDDYLYPVPYLLGHHHSGGVSQPLVTDRTATTLTIAVPVRHSKNSS
ncbi:hypothetical protein BDW42DRAFT_4568 [Aspergillus taichungensis]|uniref:Uncharacterized protein n=1 Tax=Aspergillus taichungensis TaxID=482145 RepID=A0A2J5HK23_9EURO|nr:hypothetical protein BDW42DRAFT_4568 [Aspergillus taichungensis]